MKKSFCKMCVTICGRFRPDEGAVAGYGNRIRVKSPAKWGMQIAGMIFQTRSNFRINTTRFKKVPEIGFLINPKRGCHFQAVPFCLFLFISVYFFLYPLISFYICLYLLILQFLPALLPQPYPGHPEAGSCHKCQH